MNAYFRHIDFTTDAAANIMQQCILKSYLLHSELHFMHMTKSIIIPIIRQFYFDMGNYENKITICESLMCARANKIQSKIVTLV